MLSLVEAAGERLASSNGWSSAAARLKQRMKLHKTPSKCDANLKTILDRAGSCNDLLGGCRPPTDNVLEKRNAVPGCLLLLCVLLEVLQNPQTSQLDCSKLVVITIPSFARLDG